MALIETKFTLTVLMLYGQRVFKAVNNATQVNHVVIRERKNVGMGTFLCIVALRVDRV